MKFTQAPNSFENIKTFNTLTIQSSKYTVLCANGFQRNLNRFLIVQCVTLFRLFTQSHIFNSLTGCC